MSEPDLARYLSPSDVAQMLDIPLAQVYRLLRSGELVGLKIGDRGPYRIDVDQVAAFIQHRYAVEREAARLRQADFVNVIDFTDGTLL